MMEQQARKKNFSLTFLQVVCAIAVVTLHTNGCFWSFSATEGYWVSANVIECVCYFAVPIFFMIAGITLIDYQKRYNTKVYFLKRIEKTVLPYVAWSLIGVVFLIVAGKIDTNTITMKWLVNGLLSGNGIISLFWFFPPLFCVYLCIPLFAAIEKEKKKKIAEYVLGMGLVVNILIPFINSVLELGVEWPYRIAVSAEFLFWVWAGYYMYNYPPTKKQKLLIYVLAVIGLLMHIVGTYTLSMQAGEIQSTYKGYNNLPCVLYTLGVFLLLKDLSALVEKIGWLRVLVTFAGAYTFPLYLIQWFILQILVGPIGVDTHALAYRLVAPYGIFLAVIGITWCMRKVPIIRKIVP